MMTVLSLSQSSLNLLLLLTWQQYARINAADRYILALSDPGYTHQEMPVEGAK